MKILCKFYSIKLSKLTLVVLFQLCQLYKKELVEIHTKQKQDEVSTFLDNYEGGIKKGQGYWIGLKGPKLNLNSLLKFCFHLSDINFKIRLQHLCNNQSEQLVLV